MLKNLKDADISMKNKFIKFYHFSTHFSLYDHFFRIKILRNISDKNLRQKEKINIIYQYDIEKVAMMVSIKYEYN